MQANKENIWQWAQNKPTLIVNDICEKYPDVDSDFIYNTLLKRGVFKWLSVRRDLIKLKDQWRDEISKLCTHKKVKWDKGYLKALENCLKEIRELCHSERFTAPDFDRKANEYLNSIGELK